MMGFAQEENQLPGAEEEIAQILAFPVPPLWWAYKVERIGPPPLLQQFLLDEMSRSRLGARDWWAIVGGEQGRFTYAEIDYALRWLRL